MNKGRSAALVGLLAVGLLPAVQVFARQTSAARTFPHPFQTVEPVNGKALQAATARVMQMSDAEIAQLISEKGPIRLVGCPGCEGGAQDTGADKWSIDDPWHVKCRYCEETYPSARFPLNGELKIANPLGQTQSYPYYDGGSEKQHYFFEGAACAEIDDYFAGRAYDLARLYWATKDEKYADKAAVILDRFAQVYPGWPVHGNEGNYANWKTFFTAPPYPTQSGKWGRWIHDELPQELALAYDLIHDSAAFVELSRRTGTDVRKRIENDLFRAAVELVRLYPRYLGASGMNGTATGMIAIGRAIEEPDFVHDGVTRLRDSFAEWFFSDGMLLNGSPAYELQMLRALPDPAAMARGYSDPPGYEDPRDGSHFEDLDLAGSNAMYQRAWSRVRDLLLPDGRFAPVHDSWAHSRPVQDQPPAASKPVLIPAYGHAVLGRGAGENQIQTHLHFGYHAGHAHADELNLLLFAYGRELLSDIGYTHSKLRPWAMSTPAHNTVAVDRMNQVLTQGWIPESWRRLDRFAPAKFEAKEPVFGNLLLYDVGHEHVQVVEAEASRAYRSLAPGLQEYRRTIALVPVSATEAYVVDIFRVRGGHEHLWAAHGSADDQQQLELSLKLQPQQGTLLGTSTRYTAARDPELDSESFKGTVFGLIDRLSTGSTQESWTATWRFQDDPSLGLKLTMSGAPARKVIVGQAPSIRPAKDDNATVDQFKMPLLLVEEDAGESTFVAIWEPFKGKPFISEAKSLTFRSHAGGAVGLAIQIGDRTDYIFSDPQGDQLRHVAGTQLSFRGRFAIISERNGKLQFVHLTSGSFLARGKQKLRSAAQFEGRLLGLRRDGEQDSFETDVNLPAGEMLRGRLMLVRHPDGRVRPFTIRNVAKHDGRTFILVEGSSGMNPLPNGAGYREVYFPHAEYKDGLGSFVILNSACTAPGVIQEARP